MDVGAATRVCVAHAPISPTLFSQSDWPSAWARRDQTKTSASTSEAAGAFLFGLFVAIFARIHPSLKESLRLDDSDDTVARQSGKNHSSTAATERSAWLDVHPSSFPFDLFAGW